VTGASSGLGQAAALALAERGLRVYDFSRRDSRREGVTHITCDVTDEVQFAAALTLVRKREGRIDILINNAGFGISGAAELTDNADAKRLLEVNLFGVVNGCKAVIPLMRQQGWGRILNISSVAATIPIPFQTWYSVSKAAVSTYSAALQNELRGMGISVCTLLPGDICTGFTAAREKSPAGESIYGARIARSVAKMERDEQNGMAPEKAGRFIARVALKKRVRPEYAVGLSYGLVCALVKLLPERFKAWVIGLLYGGGN